MELKRPIQKRTPNHISCKPFPILTAISAEDRENFSVDENICWVIYTGQYCGRSVMIQNPEEMVSLYTMGYYGKGSLSRSYPSFGKTKKGIPPIIKERQWALHSKWLRNYQEMSEVTVEDDKVNTEGNINKTQYEAASHSEATPKLVAESCKPKGDEVSEESASEAVVSSTEKNKKNDDKEPESGEVENKSSDDQDSTKESLKTFEEGNKAERNENQYVLTVEEKKDFEDNPESGAKKRGRSDCNSEIPQFSKKLCNNSEVKLDNFPSLEFSLNESVKESCEEVIVVADSDNEADDVFECLNPRIEKGHVQIVLENLRLTLEEAFFLSYSFGCLDIIDLEGNFMTLKGMWDQYRKVQQDFVEKYIAYHYFRAKGWVVKPGLKFGGDFILYKKGPPFYHASYIVLVQVYNTNFQPIPEKCRRRLTWDYMGGLNRLAETTNKEVLLCQILWPELKEEEMESPKVLKNFKVNEVLLRRWQATHERDP